MRPNRHLEHLWKTALKQYPVGQALTAKTTFHRNTSTHEAPMSLIEVR